MTTPAVRPARRKRPAAKSTSVAPLETPMETPVEPIAPEVSSTADAQVMANTVQQVVVNTAQGSSDTVQPPKEAKPPKAPKQPKAGKAEKPAKDEKTVKAEKAPKVKLVRDSYTMPENDYANLALLKQRCLKEGVAAKKSELLRLGLQVLADLSPAELAAKISGLEKLKTGRPAKT